AVGPHRIAWNKAQGEHDNEQADRHIDIEYVAPGPIAYEIAPENGTDHRADRKNASEKADIAITRRAEMIHDDARGGWREARAAGGLQRPEQNQGIDIVGHCAAERGQRK